MTRRPEGLTASMLVGPASVLVLLSLVPPLILLARYSFNRYDQQTFMIDTFTVENYLRFINDFYYSKVLWTTVNISFVTTILCIIIGYPIAYKLARSKGRWKSIAILSIILPLFIGSTVRAIGWMGVLSRGGLIDSLSTLLGGHGMSLLYTPFAVGIGILSINLPYMILTLQSVIENIEQNLEEAADSLGASPFKRFWHVLLPLTLPAIGTGGILVFILAMNSYATPLLLGGSRFQMMGTLLYREFAVQNDWPFAAAIAFVLMLTTLLLSAISTFLVQRRYRGASGTIQDG